MYLHLWGILYDRVYSFIYSNINNGIIRCNVVIPNHKKSGRIGEIIEELMVYDHIVIGRIKMNHTDRRRKKNEVDFNNFDEWFALTYMPNNCGGLPVPKQITFKEHIRILKEKDNEYVRLLNDYNDLVDDYNKLQKAYCKATGERYYDDSCD